MSQGGAAGTSRDFSLSPSTDRVQIAFVGGQGRSGSTLLSRVLALSPQVFSMGETCYLWSQGLAGNGLCGCGRRLRRCCFWNEVGDTAFGGWDQIDPGYVERLRLRAERTRQIPLLIRPSLFPTFARRVAAYLAYLEPLYRAVAQVSGCGTLVDETKLPGSAYLLRQSDIVEMRLLHLVRSSYGACYSWTKQPTDLERDPPARPVVRTAAEWEIWNAALEALRLLGVPTFVLRYEDFVSNPAARVDAIYQFLDLRPCAEEFVRDNTVEFGVEHSIAGNPVRFHRGPETLSLDERWRTALPVGSRRLISALTAPGLRRYGYAGTAGVARRRRSMQR